MTLDELLLILTESGPSDWLSIECSGTLPSYRLAWQFGERNTRPYLEPISHGQVATYKANLSITLAWGLPSQEDPWGEAWAKQFPDPKARLCFADAFFNSALVFRQQYVVVDGGRCCLPLPSQDLGVPKGLHSFGRLLNSLTSGTDNYDDYFRRAGLTITDSAWGH